MCSGSRKCAKRCTRAIAHHGAHLLTSTSSSKTRSPHFVADGVTSSPFRRGVVDSSRAHDTIERFHIDSFTGLFAQRMQPNDTTAQTDRNTNKHQRNINTHILIVYAKQYIQMNSPDRLSHSQTCRRAHVAPTATATTTRRRCDHNARGASLLEMATTKGRHISRVCLDRRRVALLSPTQSARKTLDETATIRVSFSVFLSAIALFWYSLWLVEVHKFNMFNISPSALPETFSSVDHRAGM